jgi:hypothetical protein
MRGPQVRGGQQQDLQSRRMNQFERFNSFDLKFGSRMATAAKASDLRKFDEDEAPGIDLIIKSLFLPLGPSKWWDHGLDQWTKQLMVSDLFCLNSFRRQDDRFNAIYSHVKDTVDILEIEEQAGDMVRKLSPNSFGKMRKIDATVSISAIILNIARHELSEGLIEQADIVTLDGPLAMCLCFRCVACAAAEDKITRAIFRHSSEFQSPSFGEDLLVSP